MKTIILIVILLTTTKALAIDLNKLTSIEIQKTTSSCAIQRVIESLPDFKARINNVTKAINNISKSLKIDPCLILSITWTESHFQLRETLNKKNKIAQGLMQVKKSTRKDIINKKMKYEYRKLLTANLNSELSAQELEDIIVGSYYINYLIKRFKNIDHAIIAYNMGETRIAHNIKHKIAFGHHHDYLIKVKSKFAKLSPLVAVK